MFYLVLTGVISILFFLLAIYFARRVNKQPKRNPDDKPYNSIFQWTSVLLCLISLVAFGSCVVWHQQGLI